MRCLFGRTLSDDGSRALCDGDAQVLRVTYDELAWRRTVVPLALTVGMYGRQSLAYRHPGHEVWQRRQPTQRIHVRTCKPQRMSQLGTLNVSASERHSRFGLPGSPVAQYVVEEISCRLRRFRSELSYIGLTVEYGEEFGVYQNDLALGP